MKPRGHSHASLAVSPMIPGWPIVPFHLRDKQVIQKYNRNQCPKTRVWGDVTIAEILHDFIFAGISKTQRASEPVKSPVPMTHDYTSNVLHCFIWGACLGCTCTWQLNCISRAVVGGQQQSRDPSSQSWLQFSNPFPHNWEYSHCSGPAACTAAGYTSVSSWVSPWCAKMKMNYNQRHLPWWC